MNFNNFPFHANSLKTILSQRTVFGFRLSFYVDSLTSGFRIQILGVKVPAPDPVFCLDTDPDPVQKNSLIRIRSKDPVCPERFDTDRIRLMSDRIGNPAWFNCNENI